MLGRHDGIVHYTVGQRRGIGVATGEPLYVVHLDAANTRVIVGPREALETHKVFLRDVNWLGDGALDALPKGGIEVFAKVRSTRPPRPAVLHHADGKTGWSWSTAKAVSHPDRRAFSIQMIRTLRVCLAAVSSVAPNVNRRQKKCCVVWLPIPQRYLQLRARHMRLQRSS